MSNDELRLNIPFVTTGLLVSCLTLTRCYVLYLLTHVSLFMRVCQCQESSDLFWGVTSKYLGTPSITRPSDRMSLYWRTAVSLTNITSSITNGNNNTNIYYSCVYTDCIVTLMLTFDEMMIVVVLYFPLIPLIIN